MDTARHTMVSWQLSCQSDKRQSRIRAEWSICFLLAPLFVVRRPLLDAVYL
jgi:hypothetical protein